MLLRLVCVFWCVVMVSDATDERGNALYGDHCNDTLMCGFEGSLCTGVPPQKICKCQPEMPATNFLDKCGKTAKLNEPCMFREQCEMEDGLTDCKENRCQCRSPMVPITDKDGNTKCSSTKQMTPEQAEAIEKSLSNQIQAILEHYQQNDPVGLPGAPVPDPMDIPDMKQSFSMATMTFKKVKVYGLSKFRIEYVRSDLAALQVTVAVRIDRLDIKGDYTMSALWSRTKGGFDVVLIDVFVEGVAMLTVQRNGQLQAQEINMDITFSDITMEFENLGFLGSLFQGIINSVGTFLFDSIKPFILKEVNENIRGDVNKKVASIPNRFPNSISPFDMLLSEGRKMVRDMGYDPYHVPDYNYTTKLFNVYLRHIWLTGMSSFYRVGNVTVVMEDNTVYASAHVGTQVLTGKCQWEVNFGGLLSRAGTSSFTVDYIHVLVIISQPLNTKKRPKLEDLDLKLGNIQARIDGAGTLDYVVEFMINVLPNLLRYQIVNAVEGPLKAKVQKVLDDINVEELIKERLPEIEQMVESSS